MREIIEALGGPTAVANALGVTLKRVGNWGARGVPWEFRWEVSELAKKKQVKLPADFLKAPRSETAA